MDATSVLKGVPQQGEMCKLAFIRAQGMAQACYQRKRTTAEFNCSRILDQLQKIAKG